MAEIEAKKPFTLDGGTIFALGVAFALMPAAQMLANIALRKHTTRSLRLLFIWHAYDFLTHFIIEGSFLYHCFFSYTEVSPGAIGSKAGPFFLGHRDRQYGPLSSEAPMARLWQEYAKADHRWGGADLTVVSLELLTVGLAGPAALYICTLIRRITNDDTASPRLQARLWFLVTVLATGELYGGFMTFAPEWLSGSTQLQGDDPVYLWLYLMFFNLIWVAVPAWVLWLAATEIQRAFHAPTRMNRGSSGKKES